MRKMVVDTILRLLLPRSNCVNRAELACSAGFEWTGINNNK